MIQQRTHARGKPVDKFPLGAKCTVEYRSGVLLLLLPVSLSSLFSLFLFRSLGCARRKLWPVIYTPYGNRHWRLREHAPRRRRPRRFNTGDPFIYPVAVAVFNNRRARETYQRATGCGCFFVLDLTATTTKKKKYCTACAVLCCVYTSRLRDSELNIFRQWVCRSGGEAGLHHDQVA